MSVPGIFLGVVLVIFDRYPRDICTVSWSYFIVFLEIFWSQSRKYLVGVLEIFERCPGDI